MFESCFMMLHSRLRLTMMVTAAASAVLCAIAAPAMAGQPKLDQETCKQLHAEQATFVQSGILEDLKRGAEWGKANLSAARLRDVEQYILLDEQIKFACREATLTPEMEKAAEIAKRLELNPNLDPFAPLPDPAVQGAKPDAATGDAPDAPSGQSPPAAEKKAQAKPKLAKKPADALRETDVRTIPLTTEPIP